MPLYEYECRQCRRRTEKIQKYSDAEITICPYCGGPLDRTITAPAVHFAGGGWFKDGYGNAKPPAPSGGEAPSERSDRSDSTAKPDSAVTAAAPATGSSSSESAPATPSAPAAMPAASTPAASAPAAPAKP